jgi:hypothetical protein
MWHPDIEYAVNSLPEVWNYHIYRP